MKTQASGARRSRKTKSEKTALAGKQYTIRNVPSRVDRALRNLARTNGQSMNELLLDILNKVSDTTGVVSSIEYHDLDELIGSWVEDPKFDEALAAQSKVDTDLWK